MYVNIVLLGWGFCFRLAKISSCKTIVSTSCRKSQINNNTDTIDHLIVILKAQGDPQ